MKHIINVGDIFPTTRDGNIAIIADKGFCTFTIRFLDTGFERDTLRSQIVRGAVKDKSKQPADRKASKPKFEAVMTNGNTLQLVKLVELLDHLEDKCYKRLMNFRSGRTKHIELISITRI